MNKCIDRLDDLANLESFDPLAFKADGIVSQDVCNFVLTLALIFNDLKDFVHAHLLLQTQKPIGPFRISRLCGSYNGIELHLLRLMVGLFHEIIDLIKRSDKVIIDHFFQSVLTHLRKDERKIWNALVSIAKDTHKITPENHFALLVRNKLAFHYDPKEIYNGYNNFFCSGTHGAELAFISRGKDMASTRYFFADASARGYLMKNVQGKEAEKLIVKAIETLIDMNFMLTEIINYFIQKRRFPYKEEAEET